MTPLIRWGNLTWPKVGEFARPTGKRLNMALNSDATTDSLTKLSNRRLFLIWANLALARANRGESGLAILFIDLNQFKPINDTYGHQTGDEVLQTVAARMSSSMRSSDFLARIGGDEFAVLISGTITEDGLIIFQKHITEAISTPFSSGAMKGECITASMGCATYPDNGTTIEALMNHADHSMYTNKNMSQTQKISQAQNLSN